MILTLICPGYCNSLSICFAISLARSTISSSLIFSGITITRTSRPACIANDLSTPLKLPAMSSSCFNLVVYVSSVSRLAPGLAADIASAAWTMHAIRLSGSTSPWCASTALITSADSLYFLHKSTPSCICDPSISWSTAFPISCKSPARFAMRMSTPISPASIPDKWATSIECFNAFCPKLVLNFILPSNFTSSGCIPCTPTSSVAASPSSRIRLSTSFLAFSTISSILAGWIRPSTISFSSAIRAISLRIGSNPDNTTASGVSSIISSTPVIVSSARMLRPSLPIILPFISSLGSCTTEIVVSATWSAAHLWIALTT